MVDYKSDTKYPVTAPGQLTPNSTSYVTSPRSISQNTTRSMSQIISPDATGSLADSLDPRIRSTEYRESHGDKQGDRILNLDQLVKGLPPSHIDLHVTTWNMGNSQPPDDLTGIAPRKGGGYGLVVIGVQEATYSIKRKDGQVPSQSEFVSGKTRQLFDFHGALQAWLGEYYLPVETVKLLEMRLIVFAHRNLRGHLSAIDVMDEATGIAHVVGNKGGLVVRMCVGLTSLAFVSCHLAAHEGQEYLERRNSDTEEVLQGVRFREHSCNPKLDLLAQTDHVFWLGDLNYRVDLAREGCKVNSQGIDKSSMNKKELAKAQFDVVKTLIDTRSWDLLWSADELSNEIKHQRALAGFVEGKYNFPPTFKVQFKKQGMHYNPERTPAWCDRILWRSNPGLKAAVRQHSLGSSPEVSTSDHKPVWATFAVDVENPSHTNVITDSKFKDCPDLVISSLAGHNLKVCDLSDSDPYIKFYIGNNQIEGSMLNELAETKKQNDTLNPCWGDDVPILRCNTANKSQLEKQSLTMAVYDYDFEKKIGDEMGFAQICLADAVGSAHEIEFDEPVILNGVKYGKLTGTIKMVWPDRDGRRAYREKNKKEEACCTLL